MNIWQALQTHWAPCMSFSSSLVVVGDAQPPVTTGIKGIFHFFPQI